MNKAILDTDIFSEILRGKSPAILTRASTYREALGHYTLSVITVFEVVKGYQKIRREEAIRKILSAIEATEVLPFDAASAIIAGRISGDLEAAGRTIGRADPMIAASAIRHDLTLVTGNTAHYERVRAMGYPLRLENWQDF